MVSKGILYVLLLIAAIGIFIYYVYRDPINLTYNVNVAANEKAGEIRQVQKYQLPEELKEVSGIAFLKKDHFLCIQDENGIVYLYKTDNESIEKEVKFSGDGDYEDLVLVDEDVYVLKSDGTIYHVSNFLGEAKTEVYKFPSDEEVDFEGLAYDAEHNRLLMAQKNSKRDWENYKNIYGFDLINKTFDNDPVYRINLENPLLTKAEGKAGFNPSAITMHPSTGEIYFLDGRNPKLLIMSKNGELKTLYELNDRHFPQPEGMIFNSDGKLFISNEGKDNEGGTILELEIIE